jgi:hypothetical protein
MKASGISSPLGRVRREASVSRDVLREDFSTALRELEWRASPGGLRSATAAWPLPPGPARLMKRRAAAIGDGTILGALRWDGAEGG